MFVFRDQTDQPAPTPEEMQKTFEKWMAWVESMKTKGQYLAGEPLEEVGKVLRGPRGSSITDGPFVEAKEIVSGFMLIKAASFAEAVEISKDCPGYESQCSVEVRQIMEMPG